MHVTILTASLLHVDLTGTNIWFILNLYPHSLSLHYGIYINKRFQSGIIRSNLIKFQFLYTHIKLDVCYNLTLSRESRYILTLGTISLIIWIYLILDWILCPCNKNLIIPLRCLINNKALSEKKGSKYKNYLNFNFCSSHYLAIPRLFY